MSNNNNKLWTRDFIIIAGANFFVALTFYLLMTTMTVYAIEQFQAAESKAGLASSIFIIGALFARLFAGKFIEVIGRKKLLRSSFIVFLAAVLLYFPVRDLNLLLIVRFIHGLAFGAGATAISTIIMSLIPNERRGEGVGYFSLSATAATAIGPFLGLFIVEYGSFQMILIACTAFSILSLVITWFAQIPEAQLTDEQLQEMKKGLGFRNFFEPHALPISLMMILMGISYSGIVSFLNAYALEIKLTKAASFFFIVYAIFLFISRPITGKLLDRKGDNIVIYPSLVIYCVSLVILSQATSGWAILVTGALTALGHGTLMSSTQAIAVKVSPRHRVGLATSTFYICMDSGMGIGPFLLGTIIPFVGYRGMYLALACIVFLAIFMYHFVHGKKAAKNKAVSLKQ